MHEEDRSIAHMGQFCYVGNLILMEKSRKTNDHVCYSNFQNDRAMCSLCAQTRKVLLFTHDGVSEL